MSGVVVLSPSEYSSYTICVTIMLMRSGVEVEAVVLRKLLNPQRFLQEFRMYGPGPLAKKIAKKLVLKDRAYSAEDFETIADMKSRLNIQFSSVSKMAKAHGIPVVKCGTLNDDSVVNMLERVRPEAVVFTGGGIIRKRVLDRAGAGVINCHMGILPRYRGMDVIEWAVLEGRADHIGVTAHLMDSGIDTGPIIGQTEVKLLPADTFARIRDRFEPVMCEKIVNATAGLLSGGIQLDPQRTDAGRQYFRMHPELLRIAEGTLPRAPDVHTPNNAD